MEKQERIEFLKKEILKHNEAYYKNDNPDGEVIVRWRAHANLLFTNWIHHYVNQGKF